MALLMSAIDATIVSVSLPTLEIDLHANLAWVGWTLNGYQLAETIVMPIVGKLSDEWGRKRLFLGAVVLFTASSMLAGLAPNIYWLIVFRALQGLGGGAFMPSATGIISDAFTKRRATAIGLFGSIFPIGGILGPNLGGFIIDHFSWRWIFYVNVPIGIALFVLGLAMLPKDAVVSKKSRIDMVGATLFGMGMVSVLYGMTTWADHPQEVNPLTWVFFAVGVALLAVFAWHEGRIPSPIIDIQLLRWRPFLATNLYNFIFGAAIFGFFSFIPYYAITAYGMTAGESGIVLSPRSLMMIIMSALSSLFLIRFGYRRPMIIGVLLIAASLFLLSRGYHDVTLLGLHVPNLALLAMMILVSGIGLGIANPASSNAALDLIPEKVAAASGIRGMFRFTGGTLGTGALILVLSHFPDKAVGLQYIFLFFGFMMLALIPIVFLIPDTARQRHLAGQKSIHPNRGGDT